MPAINFREKSLIFVTGASRGIGRSIALEISRIVHPDSTLVLIASSSVLLEDTKAKIHDVSSVLKVITHPLDLSNPSVEVYEKLIDDVLGQSNVSELSNSVFIHNAGTVGNLKKTLDLADVDLWRKFYDLNVISAVMLNTVFVQKTKNLAKNQFIVNISSLCGKVPFNNMSMYGSSKAARELFFKVFSLEEPDSTVLNYSPGPVETDMFNTVANDAQDEGVRKTFKETSALKPEQTVTMLLDILQKGNYKSGDTIDYFDRI